MNTHQEHKPSPIEVWLRKSNIEVTCNVYAENESDHQELDVNSLSIRGAQREMTSYLISRGYEPVGRWETEADDNGYGETMRAFRLRK